MLKHSDSSLAVKYQSLKCCPGGPGRQGAYMCTSLLCPRFSIILYKARMTNCHTPLAKSTNVDVVVQVHGSGNSYRIVR